MSWAVAVKSQIDNKDMPRASKQAPRPLGGGGAERPLWLPRHAPTAPRLWRDGIFFEIRFELRAGVVLRRGVQTLTLEPPDSTVLRAAEPHRVFDQRLEDWLEIERRAADDLEDLARRRLLLLRLGQ